jgi:predicted ArsR family transcriptional regulator
MNIEDVFSSRLRMKILKILYDVGELNVSDFARRLKVNYAAASKHLKTLEEEGILQHKMFGRICLYRYNDQSAKARTVQTLIEVWEKQNKNQMR